jgi:hypothetical protein
MKNKPTKDRKSKIALTQRVTILQTQVVRLKQKILKLETIRFTQEQKMIKLQDELLKKPLPPYIPYDAEMVKAFEEFLKQRKKKLQHKNPSL